MTLSAIIMELERIDRQSLRLDVVDRAVVHQEIVTAANELYRFAGKVLRGEDG